MHEGFAAALGLWPKSGVPENPRPWLISTARFKAIDALRRRTRFDASQEDLARYLEAQWISAETSEQGESVEDDRLRLIFTCSHPSLQPEARVALTLREVCGLTTEEIARAFLTTPRTLAQRIVRAKAKIRDARIPYRYHCRRSCQSGWARCFRLSISSSTRVTQLQRVRTDASRSDRRGHSPGAAVERTAAGAGSHWPLFFERAWCAGIGVGAGVMVGFAGARVIGRYVSEVHLPGALAFVASAVVILAAAVIASAVPAARAARVNPVEALRSE